MAVSFGGKVGSAPTALGALAWVPDTTGDGCSLSLILDEPPPFTPAGAGVPTAGVLTDPEPAAFAAFAGVDGGTGAPLGDADIDGLAASAADAPLDVFLAAATDFFLAADFLSDFMR